MHFRNQNNDQQQKPNDDSNGILIEKEGENDDQDRMKEEKRKRVVRRKNASTSTELQPTETLDFWHAKVLEYEAVTKDVDSIRTTRNKSKQLQTKTENDFDYKDYKNFSLEKIKERIKQAEKALSDYLSNWGSRWAKPSVKEEIVKTYFFDLSTNLSSFVFRCR